MYGTFLQIEQRKEVIFGPDLDRYFSRLGRAGSEWPIGRLVSFSIQSRAEHYISMLLLLPSSFLSCRRCHHLRFYLPANDINGDCFGIKSYRHKNGVI